MLSVEEEASQLVTAIQELTATSRSLINTSKKIIMATEKAIERSRHIREPLRLERERVTDGKPM